MLLLCSMHRRRAREDNKCIRTTKKVDGSGPHPWQTRRRTPDKRSNTLAYPKSKPSSRKRFLSLHAMEEGRDDVMASDPSDDAVVHPLHTGWTLWFDAGGGASRKSYGSGLRQIATVTTIQQFWSVLQNVQPLPPPSGNYYLFRVGITPAWEAVENQHGGKWVLVTRRDKTQAAWTATCVAAIAEQLESEYHDDLVCGVVVSARKNQGDPCLKRRPLQGGGG